MELSHYSTEYLSVVRSTDQENSKHLLLSPFTKPNGLWLSVDGPMDWAEWCYSESFHLSQLLRRTRVVLSESARVPVLSSAGDLLRFTEMYGEPSVYGSSLAIRWDLVARRSQGLIIAPYIHESRWSLDWYTTWDCASGCIWDSSAIRHIEPNEQWKA